MTKTKKTLWNLLILGQIIFVIKALLSFGIEAFYIFPDEACMILRARHFAEFFRIESCGYISGFEASSPFPLNSIILAPLTYFWHGTDLYQAMLILNAALVATLVWPLYQIFRNFVKSDKKIYIAIFSILFLAEFIIYEKTVMSETLFIILNIWLIHFYIKSFESEKLLNKYKSASIAFAILGALTRPFGFISGLAIIINEAIINKNRKIILLTLPIFSAFSIYLLSLFIPDLGSILSTKFEALLRNPAYFWALIKSLANQLNSFTIATFFIPMIYFANFINTKIPKFLPKIKYFLLSYIFLNFVISAQHIFGYLSLSQFDPGLLTRYIHSSIIIIYIFGLAFFFKHKKLHINKTGLVLIILSILSLFFLNYESAKHTLNTDLSYIMHTGEAYVKDLNLFKPIFKYALLPILGLLLFLTLSDRRKPLIILFSSLIIIQSTLSIVWAENYTSTSNITKYFEDKETNITFFLPAQHSQFRTKIWQLLTLTNNKVNVSIASKGAPTNSGAKIELTEEIINNSKALQEAEYIISSYVLNLEAIVKSSDLIVYKNESNDN